MKACETRNEVQMYWRLMQDLRFCHSDEETNDALDEMETLALYTESDTLKRLCQKTLSAHRPLHLVGAPA